jgi:thiol-disulfide isomerase/thioredoxin
MNRKILVGLLVLSVGFMAPASYGQTSGKSPITSIVDRNGKKLSPSDLPPGVLAWINGKCETWLAQSPGSPFPYVLVAAAPVALHEGTDLNFMAYLHGRSWSGHSEQERVGTRMVAIEPEPPEYSSPSDPSHFAIEMMDCLPTDISLPVSLAPGTLVWLGDVKLRPDTSATMKVTGQVTDQAHKLLSVNGTAYLHVRNTPMMRGLSTPIQNGHFSFPAVHMSDDYMMQATITGYEVKDDYAKLRGGTTPVTTPGLEMVATVIPKSKANISAVTAPHDGAWLTSYSEAKQASLASKKPILMDFTGSDWCGWCQRFNADVLSKPEFQAYAKDNLILLKLDFPHAKPLPPDQSQQNAQLGMLEKVDGYPTYVLVSPDDRELFRQVGYAEGGPAPFIEKLRAAANGGAVAPR